LQPATLNTIAPNETRSPISNARGGNIADNATAPRRQRNLERAKAKAGNSGGFLYAAHADAGGANTQLLPRAVNYRANHFEVRIPAPPPRVVRVADHVSERGAFAAQLTLRHRLVLLCYKIVQAPNT
jgi:hypothetical protein